MKVKMALHEGQVVLLIRGTKKDKYPKLRMMLTEKQMPNLREAAERGMAAQVAQGLARDGGFAEHMNEGWEAIQGRTDIEKVNVVDFVSIDETTPPVPTRVYPNVNVVAPESMTNEELQSYQKHIIDSLARCVEKDGGKVAANYSVTVTDIGGSVRIETQGHGEVIGISSSDKMNVSGWLDARGGNGTVQ